MPWNVARQGACGGCTHNRACRNRSTIDLASYTAGMEQRGGRGTLELEAVLYVPFLRSLYIVLCGEKVAFILECTTRLLIENSSVCLSYEH